MPQFTAAETQGLREYLQKIDSLEKRKHKLLSELEDVEFTILQARRQYAEIYNSKSSVMKLPNEILSTIFHMRQAAHRINQVPQNPIAEVNISHVCSHWRALALSMPTLWNVFRYVEHGSPRVPTDRLITYLERAQNCPLDLWFDLTEVDIVGTNQAAMLRLIIPHLHHCRRLYILSDDESCIEDLCEDIMYTPTPILEVFSVCSDSHVRPFEDVWSEWVPNILLSGAPALKFVRLNPISLFHIRPPLDSILHLRLEKRRPDSESAIHFDYAALNYILSLPLLESVSATSDFFDIDKRRVEEQALTIEARSLKHFRCRGDGRGRATISVALYFVSYVSAPSLESLTFHSVHLEPQLSLPHDRRMYFYPSIHTFSVLESCIGDDEEIWDNQILQEVLQITRTTKHFVLSPPSPECSLLLRIMTFVGSPTVQSNVWDRLEEITLHFASFTMDGYRRLHMVWPNLGVLRVPQAAMERLMAQGPLQLRSRIQVIDAKDTNLHPTYWPPGFDWVADNKQDPFNVRNEAW